MARLVSCFPVADLHRKNNGLVPPPKRTNVSLLSWLFWEKFEPLLEGWRPCRVFKGLVSILYASTLMPQRSLIRRSKGRRGSATLGPISFISMHFSAKFLSSNRFSCQNNSLTPPVWEILDLPLLLVLFRQPML